MLRRRGFKNPYTTKILIQALISMVILSLSFCFLDQEKVYGDEKNVLNKLLPREIAGWMSVGGDEFYTRETIFRYLNGGAEVYLAYDFHRLVVREYLRKSFSPIVVEIYQMSSSEDAYGIFSHDTDGEDIDLGQGAIYSMGLLRFWKDCIFVRILAERETDESKTAIMILGRSIANTIPHQGKKPKLLSFLPREGLKKQTIPFFHKQISLNLHYYLSDLNLLNLSEKTDVVLARYQMNRSKARLLLCQYQRPTEAQVAFKKFTKSYFSHQPIQKSSIRVEKIERGEYVSARWIDNLIILVLEARDRKTCESLTEAVEKRIQGIS